nr:antitoxin MazE-like protein [Kocuria sp. ZOR0020]
MVGARTRYLSPCGHVSQEWCWRAPAPKACTRQPSVQVWVPDVRSRQFTHKAVLQVAAVAEADQRSGDQDSPMASRSSRTRSESRRGQVIGLKPPNKVPHPAQLRTVRCAASVGTTHRGRTSGS